jgi:hypothetical protein
MLSEEKIIELAFKASEDETGKRNFNCDKSWLLEFAKLIQEEATKNAAAY